MEESTKLEFKSKLLKKADKGDKRILVEKDLDFSHGDGTWNRSH